MITRYQNAIHNDLCELTRTRANRKTTRFPTANWKPSALNSELWLSLSAPKERASGSRLQHLHLPRWTTAASSTASVRRRSALSCGCYASARWTPRARTPTGPRAFAWDAGGKRTNWTATMRTTAGAFGFGSLRAGDPAGR